MISGEPGWSLSLGVARSVRRDRRWRDQRGEIGDGEIGDGEIGVARGRGENARQREREM